MELFRYNKGSIFMYSRIVTYKNIFSAFYRKEFEYTLEA